MTNLKNIFLSTDEKTGSKKDRLRTNEGRKAEEEGTRRKDVEEGGDKEGTGHEKEKLRKRKEDEKGRGKEE